MKLLLIFLPLLLTGCGASAFDPKSYSELLKHHEFICTGYAETRSCEEVKR